MANEHYRNFSYNSSSTGVPAKIIELERFYRTEKDKGLKAGVISRINVHWPTPGKRCLVVSSRTMNIYSSRPVVLCLSGHDPSGGAGLPLPP
jgi:hypothetical protein